MRVSTFSSLVAATLLATTGALAYYDDEYSGALTARDLFEDDYLQERSFDDIEEYDARDYFDDEFEARDYLDDEFEARDYLDDDFEARDYDDEWLYARTKIAAPGTGRTGGSGSIPSRQRTLSLGGAGRGGLSGNPAKYRSGVSPPFRPTGLRIGGTGRGGAGIPPRFRGGDRGGMTGLRPPSGKISSPSKGRGKKMAAAVEARDLWEAYLEERGKGGPGGPGAGGKAARRRRKNQRKRLRNKLRKQKAAAAQDPAAGGAADPSAGAAAPEAAVQQRDFEVDELD